MALITLLMYGLLAITATPVSLQAERDLIQQEETLACAVCLDDINDQNPAAAQYWRCSHGEKIHKPCADKVLLSNHPACPLCRAQYKKTHYQRIHGEKRKALKLRQELGQEIMRTNPNFPKIHKLFRQGASFNTTDDNGNTLFHAIALASNNPYLIRFALKNGALESINKTNNKRITPLHCAARNGRHLTLEILLAQGAQANALDEYGNSPLDYALAGDHHNCIELLLSRLP